MSNENLTIDVGHARSCNGGAFFRVTVVLTLTSVTHKTTAVKGCAYLALDRGGNFSPDNSFGNWLTTEIRDNITEWASGVPAAVTRLHDKIVDASRQAIKLAMS